MNLPLDILENLCAYSTKLHKRSDTGQVYSAGLLRAEEKALLAKRPPVVCDGEYPPKSYLLSTELTCTWTLKKTVYPTDMAYVLETPSNRHRMRIGDNKVVKPLLKPYVISRAGCDLDYSERQVQPRWAVVIDSNTRLSSGMFAVRDTWKDL